MAPSEIGEIFRSNMLRCEGFLQTYQALGGGGVGRRPVGEVDVLRAAVIFLHATVEELLRSVEGLRLPKGPVEHLETLRFFPPVGAAKDKFTLGELAQFRGHTVEAILLRSIDRHLERSNYNSVEEVAAALERAGLPEGATKSTGARLAAMMARRHWIAHRADSNRASGKGQHVAQSLSRVTVEGWLEAVREFGTDVLTRLATLEGV